MDYFLRQLSLEDFKQLNILILKTINAFHEKCVAEKTALEAATRMLNNYNTIGERMSPLVDKYLTMMEKDIKE
jgi:hypothetical protein